MEILKHCLQYHMGQIVLVMSRCHDKGTGYDVLVYVQVS